MKGGACSQDQFWAGFGAHQGPGDPQSQAFVPWTGQGVLQLALLPRLLLAKGVHQALEVRVHSPLASFQAWGRQSARPSLWQVSASQSQRASFSFNRMQSGDLERMPQRV